MRRPGNAGRTTRAAGAKYSRSEFTRHTGGTVYAYVMGMNVIVFCVSVWTALIYGVMTRDLLGAVLWLTLGFAALTAPLLTPPRRHD